MPSLTASPPIPDPIDWPPLPFFGRRVFSISGFHGFWVSGIAKPSTKRLLLRAQQKSGSSFHGLPDDALLTVLAYCEELVLIFAGRVEEDRSKGLFIVAGTAPWTACFLEVLLCGPNPLTNEEVFLRELQLWCRTKGMAFAMQELNEDVTLIELRDLIV